MIEINEIYRMDCFDLFPQIDNNVIDLVIVDLPFGQTDNSWDVKIDLNIINDMVESTIVKDY